jgi:TPR repeat protein
VQGVAQAQYNLALMHRDGRGGPKDEVEARRLLGLAAAHGHAKAQCVLAVLHADGSDGPKDEAEARTVGASERRQ